MVRFPRQNLSKTQALSCYPVAWTDDQRLLCHKFVNDLPDRGECAWPNAHNAHNGCCKDLLLTDKRETWETRWYLQKIPELTCFYPQLYLHWRDTYYIIERSTLDVIPAYWKIRKIHDKHIWRSAQIKYMKSTWPTSTAYCNKLLATDASCVRSECQVDTELADIFSWMATVVTEKSFCHQAFELEDCCCDRIQNRICDRIQLLKETFQLINAMFDHYFVVFGFANLPTYSFGWRSFYLDRMPLLIKSTPLLLTLACHFWHRWYLTCINFVVVI